MSAASSEAIPPVFQEQVVSSCPKPRMWSISEEFIEDPQNCHHHNKVPTCASPGKAANGQDGSSHHDNPSKAYPGEASNDKGSSNHRIGHYHDNPPNACPGEASNGKRISNHLCNAIPYLTTPKQPRASSLPPELNSPRREFQSVAMVIDASPKIWPKNMMEIIKYIVKLTSICPKSPLFKFKMNGEEAEQISMSFGDLTLS